MSSLSVKRSFSVLLGIALILGMLVPLAFTTNAYADDVVSIKGKVTFQSPSGNETGLVRLYDADTDTYLAEASVSRVDYGWGIVLDLTEYAFYNLDAGNYKIAFVPAIDGQYAPEWYNGKPDIENADVIPLAEGETVSNINVTLVPVNSSLSGYVKAEGTGDPVTGFYVEAYDINNQKAGQAWTWAAGDYKITGLAPGQYKLIFDPRNPDARRNDPYLAEWYNDKSDIYTADTVTVQIGVQTTVPDVYLASGGSISGTVTGEDGPGVERCNVQAFNADGVFCGACNTDASGNYQIMGLRSGSYKVGFIFQVEHDSYLGEWYNDKDSIEEATPVSVTMPGDTPNINAVLSGHGSMTGTVVDYADSPIDVCNVYLRDAASGEVVESGITDSSGNYEVDQIPAGTYKVRFVPYECGTNIPEWWDDKLDFDTANTVEVEAFATTGNINAKLDAYGTVSGNVQADGGADLNGVKVEAWPVSGDQGAESGYTDADGNYTITNLLEGDYKILFKPQGSTPSPGEGSYYISEWYNDKVLEDDADVVSVAQGTDTPNIDAVVDVGGGLISGNVRGEESGNPAVEGCSVSACEASSGRAVAFGKTDAAGNYLIGGLPEGDYKVKFVPSASSYYKSEWYDDKAGKDDADLVTVIDLNETAGIDAMLATTGKISGRVVSEEKGNPPLNKCWVHLYDASTNNPLAPHALTDDNGEYQIENLDSGSYKIKFTPDSHDPNLSEWYNDKENAASADAVTVTVPSVVSGVDAALALPEPVKEVEANPIWYLAEGSTNWGFETYFSIGNPNSEDVSVEVTYMTEDGPVYGGATNVPANGQATVNPENAVPNQDFSSKFECKEGNVITVDRTMIWTGQGAVSPDGHCSIGVTTPNTEWYLPEGSSKWGFETWLLIQNPYDSEANCQVTYMIEGKGPVTLNKVVPPNSRRTYNMAEDIGAEDASIQVISDIGVIPERAMYRNNRRSGHGSIGSTTPQTDYFLAEGTSGWGFTTYVLVQNPNDQPADVAISYMTSNGPVNPSGFTMPANSRKTIRVNDILPGADFSTHVHGSLPIIAERAMYWNNGTGEACHDSIGTAYPSDEFYLADGQTSAGRETWTLVQNPNTHDVIIQVTYLTPSGKDNPTFQDTIPANSRRTYFMADAGITNRAGIKVTCLTPDSHIMVERAMYWNDRGAGTDTLGAFNYVTQ